MFKYLNVSGGCKCCYKNGTYTIKQAYTSTDPYTIEGMTVKLKNLGNLQVLAISDTEMTAKVYSHYHFSKKNCLPIVDKANQLTLLINAIMFKDIKKVQSLVAKGVNAGPGC